MVFDLKGNLKYCLR